MTFATDINAFKAHLRRQAEGAVRETVLRLGYAMVEKSPWGRWEAWSPKWQRIKPMPPYVPGLFKGSWDYDFEVEPSQKLNTVDQTGSSSMARIAAVKSTPAFVTHYIVNNTEYAWAIEYGHAIHNIPDPMPPGGIVRTTEVEFHTYVEQAVQVARGIA